MKSKHNKWVARRIAFHLSADQNEMLKKLVADRQAIDYRESITTTLQDAIINLYKLTYGDK